MEENGSNSRSGRIIASTFVALAILLGAMHIAFVPVSAAPVPFTLDLVPGTRTSYELNIEVDYFEGLLWPEVVEAFDFLESYFESRNITTEVDFNSTHNVIEGTGYLDTHQDIRAINYQYHDRPATHIYFLVTKNTHMGAGAASPLSGATISLDVTGRSYGRIRHVVMHEVGHCIGIGLYDDNEFEEVYSSTGFMGFLPANTTYFAEYRANDWESAFAPNETYGNSSWLSTRIWNRFSIIGEQYDDTSDITGAIIGDMEIPEWGCSIELRSLDGNDNYYYTVILPNNRNFTFQSVKPGNYTIEMPKGYQLTNALFVNVTERQTIYLGNLNVEPAQIVPIESPKDYRIAHVLVATLIVTIILLAFALRVRKNDKDEERRNHKIMAASIIAVVLLLVPSYFYLGPNDRYDAVTVNGFYDDRVDRDNDGTIGQEDMPLAWHSYGSGDRVVIRDRIEAIWFQPDENKTYIILSEYSGKFGEASPTNVLVQGNVTEIYSEGDIIMVENRMVEYEGSIYPEFNGWTLVV